MEVPGFFMGGGYFGSSGFSPEKMVGEPQFVVDDLLEIPNDDASMADGFFGAVANSGDSCSVTPVRSCNSSVSGGDAHFSGAVAHFDSDLCVPYEDMAELEWLSNFVEDSFSAGEDLRSLHVAAGVKAPTPESSCSGGFQPEKTLPVKARSKRSRAAADWSTRLPRLAGEPKSDTGDWSTRLPHLAGDPKKSINQSPARRRVGGDSDSGGRRCLHCATEKTPQWRTGPMGPKTLCNACGVRFKSGRLVPEYRPAASPTFVSARHSNSHRKVLELRRQKDSHAHAQFLGQTSVFAASNGADEYLIHRHRHLNGPDYGHMI